MIPLVASVSIRNRRNRGFRLWIPLVLVWLLLLPVGLLLLPVMFLACWASRIDPLRALEVFWDVLSALKGANVEVENAGSSVLIHVF